MENNKKPSDSRIRKKGKKKKRTQYGQWDNPAAKEETGRPKVNDYKWYNRNQQILKDAGSISTNTPLGLKNYFVNFVSDIASTVTTGPSVIPGIAKLNCIPSIGVSKDGSSDVNNAMRLIYAFVRHANSGSRNYEAPDYMTYLLAMRSIYDFHAEMVRLYGLCNIFSVVNRYIAKGIVQALGYNYEDIVKNLSSLRYYINQYAIKANTFAVPKEMYYYDRGAFVPLHVFKDSEEDKAGLYVMQYAGYYKWSATGSTKGSSCDFVGIATIDGTPIVKDFASIVTFGNSLLEAMLTNEDIGIMSGDTLKCFSNSGLRQLTGIPADYATVPVYNKDVLNQIHNTVFVGDLKTFESAKITQDSGILLFDPTFKCSDSGAVYVSLPVLNPVFDCDKNDPTPEEVMEWSRHMAAFETADGKGEVKLFTAGSEIFTTMDIFWLNMGTGDVSVNTLLSEYSNGVSAADLTQDQLASLLIYKHYFDWSPIMYYFGDFADNDTIQCYPIGELFNYTPLDKTLINKLHNVALLSLFNVPGLGKSV